MKLKLLILTCIVSFAANAQWVTRAGFPGISRAKATAFTIGSKIYVMGGVDNSAIVLNDFWEYDIIADSWTQGTSFPGAERYGAVSFVLNNKGYISTGGNDNGYLDDLWEYDPITSSWAQRTGLPAGQPQHENQRTEAYSFVIGNKAYLGGGNGFVFMPNSTGNIAFYDLWEYDPATNSWSQKADIPDFIGRNMSVAAAINNKGYVGLGCNVDQNINRTSFWEYDPVADSWTSKTSFPTNFTTDAGAFVLDSNLYVTGGVNLTPVTLSNQFYRYDPVTDTWTHLPNFSGGAIAGEFAVSTGTRAFAGTGYNAGIQTRSGLWEYTTAVTGINQNGFTTDNMITIYPDPASENISIASQKDISFIEVYDVAGNIIMKKENAFKNIPVQNLSAGFYNMKLSFDDGSLLYKRFMKIN